MNFWKIVFLKATLNFPVLEHGWTIPPRKYSNQKETKEETGKIKREKQENSSASEKIKACVEEYPDFEQVAFHRRLSLTVRLLRNPSLIADMKRAMTAANGGVLWRPCSTSCAIEAANIRGGVNLFSEDTPPEQSAHRRRDASTRTGNTGLFAYQGVWIQRRERWRTESEDESCAGGQPCAWRWGSEADHPGGEGGQHDERGTKTDVGGGAWRSWAGCCPAHSGDTRAGGLLQAEQRQQMEGCLAFCRGVRPVPPPAGGGRYLVRPYGDRMEKLGLLKRLYSYRASL